MPVQEFLGGVPALIFGKFQPVDPFHQSALESIRMLRMRVGPGTHLAVNLGRHDYVGPLSGLSVEAGTISKSTIHYRVRADRVSVTGEQVFPADFELVPAVNPVIRGILETISPHCGNRLEANVSDVVSHPTAEDVLRVQEQLVREMARQADEQVKPDVVISPPT